MMTCSKAPHDLFDESLVNIIQRASGEIDAGDGLIELRNRYLPMIKGMLRTHYARGMDFEDWLQEALFVMIKCIRRYNPRHQVKFRAFYRSCLRNWFNDLVRKQTARKRIPNKCLTSYNANQKFYDDVLGDVKAIHPEQSIMVTEFLRKFIYHCSNFEAMVILRCIIYHQSTKAIAERYHCSTSKVRNAFARCRVKYRNLQNDGLN